MSDEISRFDRFVGAFMGYATGDAYGYPLQLMSYEDICERFEKLGAMRLPINAKADMALFTDDTQIALFTAEGINWADSLGAKEGNVNYVAYIFYALQAWALTQTKEIPAEYEWITGRGQNAFKTKLLKSKGLYKRRSSDESMLETLAAAENLGYGRLIKRINDNKDNGAIKSALPAGLYFACDIELAFRMGADFSAITHTNPTGYLSAGTYAAIIAGILCGHSPLESVKAALKVLSDYDGAGEVLNAVSKALDLIEDTETEPRDAVELLGNGENAEDALAIAVYCSVLHRESYTFAVQLAVNQDGASDTCGALTGGILGAYYGTRGIPVKWIKKLQYKNLICDICEKLEACAPEIDPDANAEFFETDTLQPDSDDDSDDGFFDEDE